MKTFIHPRPIDGCLAGWAEYDTQAPNETRHECARAPHDDDVHWCICGLLDEDSR